MVYNKETMESAIEEVKTGAGSTLYDHLLEKHIKVDTGGPTVLTYTT